MPGLLLPANHFDSTRQIKVGPCINGDGCATAIPTSLDSWETSACSRPRKPQPTWSCPPGSCAPGGKTWSFTLIWLNFLEISFGFPKTSIRKCSARFHGRFPVSHRSCSSWRGHGFENLGLTLEASHQLTVRSNKSDPSNWYSIE